MPFWTLWNIRLTVVDAINAVVDKKIPPSLLENKQHKHDKDGGSTKHNTEDQTAETKYETGMTSSTPKNGRFT